jgi:hypothetical protein
MAIDVLNHMWVGVFSASYVAQQQQRMQEGRGPAIDEVSDRFAEEAAAVADMALESYKRNCAEESRLK